MMLMPTITIWNHNLDEMSLRECQRATLEAFLAYWREDVISAEECFDDYLEQLDIAARGGVTVRSRAAERGDHPWCRCVDSVTHATFRFHPQNDAWVQISFSEPQ
jgi:hypothetical protein